MYGTKTYLTKIDRTVDQQTATSYDSVKNAILLCASKLPAFTKQRIASISILWFLLALYWFYIQRYCANSSPYYWPLIGSVKNAGYMCPSNVF